MGISASRSPFPVQALTLEPDIDAVRLHRALRDAGVQTLLVRNRNTSGAKLMFVFNASHNIDDVDDATVLLNAAIRVQRQGRGFDWTKRRRDDAARALWVSSQ